MTSNTSTFWTVLADAIDSVQGMPLDEDPQTRDEAYRARNRAIIWAVCGEVDYASEIRKWHDRLGRSDDGRRLHAHITAGALVVRDLITPEQLALLTAAMRAAGINFEEDK